MAGLMQVMIYLMCVYLGYKGIEIFQIAYMSNSENKSKGIIIGIILILGAILVSAVAVYITEDIASRISTR